MLADMGLSADANDDTRHISLAAGDLKIDVEVGLVELDQLCDFAIRNNSRRGFLIVSRVLGRHLPVKPSIMQAAFNQLSSTIPCNLPGPVIFIGMAETAICLGQGVHAAWQRSTGRQDTLYIHTTRQQVTARVVATFEEPHSHATSHIIYEPSDDDRRSLFYAARSLVLVDDEASTGTTLLNLAAALVTPMPFLERIHTAVLTDWSADESYAQRMPKPTTATSLLKGRLKYHPSPDAKLERSSSQVPVAALGYMRAHKNYGRLGIQGIPLTIDDYLPNLGDGLCRRFLVLGTGEFVYPPFLLAARLEALGHDVEVQATTRSPIHLGGAIRSVIELIDNYATGVPNFLYNVAPVSGRRVLICHETPVGSIDPSFTGMLNAECIFFGEES